MSTTPNDGGPAFPGERGESGYGSSKRHAPPGGGPSWIDLNQGMSLRDYFAAKAMQSYMSDLSSRGHSLGSNAKEIVEEAYNIADSMLVARNSQPTNPNK